MLTAWSSLLSGRSKILDSDSYGSIKFRRPPEFLVKPVNLC